MQSRAGLCWFLVGALCVGCGHTTKVRPTPPGAIDGDFAFGGPLGSVEHIPLALPLSTIGASYGIAERFDVEAHAHVTALVLGVLGLDVGGSYLAVRESGWVPAVNVNARVYGFTNFQRAADGTYGLRGYFELTPSVSYLLGGRFLTYVSGTAFAQTAGGPLLFAASVGEEVELGRWGLQLELRWFEPTYDARNLPPNWFTLAGQGAWGALIGVRHRFGGSP